MKDIYQYVKEKGIVLLIGIVTIFMGGYFFLSHKASPVKSEPKQELVTKKNEDNKQENKTKELQTIVVDIQGAVKNPGVYHVKNKAILQEVLQMAGGLTENADIKQINRAKRVVDQMQIYVPNKGEQSSPGSNMSQNGSDNKKIVNINTAVVDDFKDVTGIGPKKAEKIIAYREEHGQFETLHDLTKVSGIGEKSLENLKEQLSV